jgi:nucleotide-binding universal stress UspA family protein
VVGYDGSPDACAALDAAIEHIGSAGTLHVVTVIDGRTLADVDRVLRETPPGLRPTREHPEAVLRRALDDARLLAAARGVAHAAHLIDEGSDRLGRSSVATDGDPATALLELVSRVGADMIAVGCHGLGRDRSFARGTVASRIAHHAPASVLIALHHDSDGPGTVRPHHRW